MATFGPLVRQVGPNLGRLRRERGLKLKELAARLDALGYPIGVTGLSKIENQVRSVSLDELVALARTLNVAPALLIFPLGHQPTVELLPGVTVDTWTAVRWFTGTDDELGEDSPIARFREQDRLIEHWRPLCARAIEARERAAREQADGRPDRAQQEELQAQWAEEAARGNERQLALLRELMRREGLDPGEPPAELARVDEVPDGIG